MLADTSLNSFFSLISLDITSHLYEKILKCHPRLAASIKCSNCLRLCLELNWLSGWSGAGNHAYEKQKSRIGHEASCEGLKECDKGVLNYIFILEQ